MENKKLAVILTVLCFGVLGSFLTAGPNPITTAPQTLASLDARWAWAADEAGKLNGKTGFFIGYSILRNMGEHSTIGCHSDKDTDKTTLYELVYGKKPPQSQSALWQKSVAEIARIVLEDNNHQHEPEKKVPKEIAILFQFTGENKFPFNCRKIKISNIELPVNLDNTPLFWLGQADNPASLNLLEKVFNELEKTKADKIKGDIIMAVGLHEPGPKPMQILKKVLTGNQPEDVREKAVFWMGEQENWEAVKILTETIRNDTSLKIQEEAVFALYRIRLPEADQELIRLAQHGSQQKIRKKAIFWLGQKAVKRTAEVLTGVVNDDKDSEIQETAVFAISQLPDPEGVPRLITIAKSHKNINIRKKAIFWLSQSDDPRALKTIIDMINQ